MGLSDIAFMILSWLFCPSPIMAPSKRPVVDGKGVIRTQFHTSFKPRHTSIQTTGQPLRPAHRQVHKWIKRIQLQPLLGI